MKTVVIYGTRHGNTQKIAYAIGDGLRTKGSVQLFPIDSVWAAALAEADLVLIGGPTEARGMSVPVKQFFDDLAHGALKGKLAASFDTRLDWPRWLSGSASSGIGARMRQAGAELVAAPGSFIVKGKGPQLEPGELARAVEWGLSVGRQAEVHLGLPVPVA